MGAVTVTATPRIHGTGRPEEDWRRSPWLQAVPSMRAEAWLDGVRRLVVVSPHPDDEVLGCGGLIHTARSLRIEVRIVSVTDGEACYPDSRRWSRERLRRTRRAELVAALDCLDVPPDCIDPLDVGDGNVHACEAALTASLHDMLQAGDHVLTTWRGDGHPDHEATARAVEQAARARGAATHQFPVWAWHWMSAGKREPDFARALRLCLGTGARSAKRRALDCFGSQLDSGDADVAAILPAAVRARFERGYEVVLP